MIKEVGGDPAETVNRSKAAIVYRGGE